MQLILNTFGASLRKKDGMFLIRAGDRKIAMSPAEGPDDLAGDRRPPLDRRDPAGPGASHRHRPAGQARRALRPVLARPARLDQPPAPPTAGGRPSPRTGPGWPASGSGPRSASRPTLLRDLARTRPDRAADLEDAAGRLDKLAEIVAGARGRPVDELRGSLMGLEGVAGREYFAALSLALPERFRFQGRSRSPAKDEFNCLLNYAYGVLYSLVERACLLSGLDPCIGLLHTDNYNKPSLVFDLIELFRVHAERVVVNLFAARKVKQELFDQKRGGLPAQRRGAGPAAGGVERLPRPGQAPRPPPAQDPRHDRLRVPAARRPAAPRPGRRGRGRPERLRPRRGDRGRDEVRSGGRHAEAGGIAPKSAMAPWPRKASARIRSPGRRIPREVTEA